MDYFNNPKNFYYKRVFTLFTFEATMCCCFIPSISKPRNLFLFESTNCYVHGFRESLRATQSETDERNKVFSSLWSERERERSREFMHERRSGVDLISLRRLGLWLSDLFPGVFLARVRACESRTSQRSLGGQRATSNTCTASAYATEIANTGEEGGREGNEITREYAEYAWIGN